MLPGLAADLVLLVHLAFVLFAVFGGLFVLFRPGAAWVHIPAVLWSSLINLAGWTCPLTPVENYFLARAGEAGYEGGFLAHYIEPLVYPAGMPREFELVAGISVLVWNGVVYAFAAYRWRRRRT